MTYQDIQDALHRLSECTEYLNNLYEETGGEVTDDSLAVEQMVDDLKALLSTEGVDSLGRWLKAREDARAALKAERDYILRQIHTADETIDFIKSRICHILQATGTDKVKGSHGYSFTRTESRKVTVDTAALNDRYLDAVVNAVAGLLPPDVSVSLKASVSSWRTVNGDAAELPPYYLETVTPSVRFTKPRKVEDDGAES